MVILMESTLPSGVGSSETRRVEEGFVIDGERAFELNEITVGTLSRDAISAAPWPLSRDAGPAVPLRQPPPRQDYPPK